MENNLELFARHLLLLGIALESKNKLGLQGTVNICMKKAKMASSGFSAEL